MNKPSTTSEAVHASPTASRLERAFRAAMLLLTFAVCCYVAWGLGRWWALAQHGPTPLDTHSSAAAQLDPFAAALGGQWAFDELDWDLKSQLVDRGAIDAELSQLGNSPLSKLDPQLPDTDPEIIKMITAMNIHPTQRSGDLVYRVDRPDLRVELTTRIVAEQSKTVAFAMAYPQNGDAWQLYVFTPKQSTDDSASPAPHLLPLPAGAHRSGGRFANDGRVLLELISLDSTADELVADWKQAGWQIRPSGIANPADFSVLCARGNNTVYAWSGDPHDSLQNLMLVHTPTPADTSP